MAPSIVTFWTTHLFIPTILFTGLLTCIYTVTNYRSIPLPTFLCLSIYVILPLHAYEEWVVPGGFGWMYNHLTLASPTSTSKAMSTSASKSTSSSGGGGGSTTTGKFSDRASPALPAPPSLPLDKLQHSLMLSGGMVYGLSLIYLVGGTDSAVVASRLVFAGMEVVLHVRFGIAMKREFGDGDGGGSSTTGGGGGDGIVKGKRIKETIYNPGLGTALLGFLPVVLWGVAWLLGIVREEEERGAGGTRNRGSIPLAVLGRTILMLMGSVLVAVVGPRWVRKKLVGNSDGRGEAGLEFEPGYFERFLDESWSGEKRQSRKDK